MKVKILMLLLHLAFLSCKGQNIQNPGPIEEGLLKEDFKLFRIALEEAHPGLYTHTPKVTLDSAFDAVENTINRPLSQQEFYRLLTPLATMVRCGHLKFMVKDKEDIKFPFHQNNLFPLNLHFSKEGVFVLKSYCEKELIPPGAKVISINDKPIEEIVNQLLNYVTFADGLSTTGKYLELNNYFSGYYDTFIETSNSFLVAYEDKQGNTRTQNLAGIDYSMISQTLKERQQELQQEPLSIRFLENETALLTLKSFWFEDKSINFEKFLSQAFRQISDKKVKSLIIDVRNNDGGKDSYGALLYSYLADKPFNYYAKITTNTDKKFTFSDQAYLPWFFGMYRMLLSKRDGEYIWKYHNNVKLQKPQKEPFHGKAYVLINGHSFSVTSEFASVAHHHGRATFIGEETGGGYHSNNSGFFTIVDLPHSNLVLGIPLWKYHQAVENPNLIHRGIIPDHQIKVSVEDLIQGKDPVLEAAFRLIN